MNTSKVKNGTKGATYLCMAMLFGMSIAYNMYSTLISSIIDTYDMSMTQASSITAATSTCSILLMIFITVYGDRINKGIALGIVGILYGGLLMLLGSINSLVIFFPVFVTICTCANFTESVTSAHVSDLAGDERGKAIPTLRIFFSVGSIVAPVLAAVLLTRSGTFTLPYGTVGAWLFAAGILMLVHTLRKPHLRSMHKATAAAAGGDGAKFKLPVKEMMSSRRFVAVVLAMVFNTAFYFVVTMLTDYLGSINKEAFPVTFCSVILTFFTVGSLITSLIYSTFSSKINEAGFITLGGVVCTAAMLFGVVVCTPAAWLIAMSLVGLFGGAGNTMRMVLACNEFPNNSGSAMAIVNMAVCLSNFIFYMIGGALADNVSYTLAIVVAACGCIVASGFTVFGYGKKAFTLKK